MVALKFLKNLRYPCNLFCLDMKFHSTYGNDKSHWSSKTPDERLRYIHPTAEISWKVKKHETLSLHLIHLKKKKLL